MGVGDGVVVWMTRLSYLECVGFLWWCPTQTVVTCLETLQKDSDDPRGVGSVVVGTENREILILDPSGTSILKKIRCALIGHTTYSANVFVQTLVSPVSFHISLELCWAWTFFCTAYPLSRTCWPFKACMMSNTASPWHVAMETFTPSRYVRVVAGGSD